MQIVKLVLYAGLLYLIRLYVIGWLEQLILFGPMHEPMAQYPDCFGFTEADLPLSHLFNYLIWFSVILIFHLSRMGVQWKVFWHSLLIFGLAYLFYLGIAGAFMNHFNQGIRVFFRYAMLDAFLVFGILGIVNGLSYPYFFKFQQKP